jgi:[protein-PII] uridylyltransferase
MPPQPHLEKVLNHAQQRLVPKPGATPAQVLNLYRRFLKVEEHRLRLWHRAGADGRTIARGRAQLLDVVLQHLFRSIDAAYLRQHPDATAPLALIATGGYGRTELCPHSDIDIMFLHDSPARGGKNHPHLEAVVKKVLYMLWDLGLKVGHSTRTIREAVQHANADMQSKTALIESRLIVGDEKLYDRFREQLIAKCVRGHEDEYIAERMADQRDRHQKFGDSVYMQEPNVKSGCGGLRDLQNLIWMAFFKYGVTTLGELRQRGSLEASEQRELERAYDFLLRVRIALHYMTNSGCDLINLGLQAKLADEFGYRQHDRLRRIETFMREYYVHSRAIFYLTNALTERLALTSTRVSGLGALLGRSKRKVEEFDGFTLADGRLSAATPAVFKQDPLRLFRAFAHAQQHEADLSPELRSRIRQNLNLVNRTFQHSRAARDTFLGILQHKGQVARILRLMHETEVLGKYLPEFGRLTCLVQHEFFHRYTTDEHTLQVVEHLDRIIDATTPPYANYRRMFQQLERQHVLYLAILLHDTGKAANVPHHVEASMDAARKVARRLLLEPDEAALLLFLVRDHLKLAMLSQRRDIDDEATIAAAARIVKNGANLDLLHLFTFVDSIGTGAKMWSDWKEALLWQLYHRTKQELTGTERAKHILARRIEQLYGEVSRKLSKQLALEEIYSHFELMPASYYINTNAEEISRHLLLIHQFLERQATVEQPEDALAAVVQWQAFPAQSHSRLTICTWDRLGLFSRICGALSSTELNILSAHIYTRGDQVVLDMFDVCDKHLEAVTDEPSIKAAETMLQRALTNRETIHFTELLARMRAVRRGQPQTYLPTGKIGEVQIPTVIEFDNEISKNRTVIEIQTENRLGLLYAITQTLADLGLDISFAKIFTEKGAAIDSFYVQDQQGQQVTDPDRLETIKTRLESAIALLAS